MGPLGAAFRAPSAGTATPDPSGQLSPLALWVQQPLPFAPGLGSRLRFLLRCHPGDKAWLAGWGWGGRVAWGVGSSAPARSGGRGAGSHEIPSQGMWSGRPALGEPAPSKPVALLPAGHPPSAREKPGTWEPGSLWWPHPALLEKHKLSGSLKKPCY